MLLRLALTLGLLSAPSLAQGTVWRVDNVACPGIDFTVLQDAIDVASDGDTILVTGALSSPQIQFRVDGKALTIIAAPGVVTGPAHFLPSVVLNLAPNQRVVLRGLDIDGGLAVLDCAGPVWIEDCDISVSRDFGPQPAFEARDSDNVSLVRCDVSLEDSPAEEPSGAGILVDASTVFVVGSSATGGVGEFATAAPKVGTPGVHAVGDSFVLLSGSTAQGGNGGADLALPCTPAPGGPGLLMDDVFVAAWSFGSTLAGGVGTAAGPCGPGAPGPGLDGVGAFHLQDLGGPARDFSAPASGFEGETVDLHFEPQPADQVFLLLALDVAPVQVPGWKGALVPELSGSVLIALGAPGGPVDVPIGLPSGVLGAGEALGVALQALYLDGGERVAGPGSLLTILDDGLQGGVDCGTWWVDDDAAGDPAPGDPATSDPLEDGTAAHPYDSIQEALDVALPGATVIVRDGTYDEPGSAPITFGGKQLLLRSENGPATCTVLADDIGFRFGIEPAGSELSGFTVVGAQVEGIKLDTGSSMVVSDCVVRDGMGTGLSMDSLAQPLVRDCRFEAMQEGAVVVGAGANAKVERCTMLDNDSSLVGAGVFVEAGGHVTLRDSILSSNTAFFGSGVFIEGSATISGCTIAHNPAGPGSELFVTTGGTATVDNSILWGGTAPVRVHDGGALALDWCDVKGGLAALSAGLTASVTWGANTIDVLPHFKDVPGGDLHLKAGSPCRDAGDPAAFIEPGRTDIDGEARVQGAAVDLGADELP